MAAALAPISNPYPAYKDINKNQDDSDLLFGDFCFGPDCGNATVGSAYCSTACRLRDSHNSSDTSPNLKSLPALVESGNRSICSTPPSSAQNSPSPLGGISDLTLHEEPPEMNLPPPSQKLGIAHSLPIAVRYPVAPNQVDSDWSIDFTQLVPRSAKTVSSPSEDLTFRRRSSNRSKPSVPAPLYYREQAAYIHNSPALSPTRVAQQKQQQRRKSSARRLSSNSVHSQDQDITDLNLPPLSHPHTHSHTRTTQPHSSVDLTLPNHCGRLGCVGTPKKSKTSSNRTKARMSFGNTSLQNNNNDLLISPRIIALRHDDTTAEPQPAETESALNENSSSSEDEENHSAFACYLFNQLSIKRGRSQSQSNNKLAERSVSADAALSEETIRVNRKNSAKPRTKLTAGHFIQATTTESETNSPLPSSPHSPPTLARGRSLVRHPSATEFQQIQPNLADPRGRSKLRGTGAIHRSLSPEAREASRGSSSRSRTTNSSRASSRRTRQTEISVAEVSDEDSEIRGRGRGRGRD